MKTEEYPTIKSLVLDFIHRHDGLVDYAELEAEVLRNFPTSAFKETHWSWYRYQCTKGRFANQFSSAEKRNMGVRPDGVTSAAAKAAPLSPPENGDLAVPVTKAMLTAVLKTIEAAIEYEQSTEGTRKMGITGEVGEVLACHQLNLLLCMDSRSQGYDAIDSDGRKVQIKTRRSETPGLPKDFGRISTFSKHPFDYAILVMLDNSYRPVELWQAEYDAVAPLIEKQKRRNPGLGAFKKLSKRIWCKDSQQFSK